MRTVNEVSKLTGVSIRTLQYYDKIGLLKPTEYTESGYRLYDDTAGNRTLYTQLVSVVRSCRSIVGCVYSLLSIY